MLYLYLASNAHGFELALSPAAIKDAIGMPRSTFHDQFHKLQEKGYIIPHRGNTYDFYEVPQFDNRNANNEFSPGQEYDSCSDDDMDMLALVQDVLGEDIQINNKKYPQIGAINNEEPYAKWSSLIANQKYDDGFVF